MFKTRSLHMRIRSTTIRSRRQYIQCERCS